MKQQYWDIPIEKLINHVVENWQDDEEMDVADALHRYYEETRCPRDWTEINLLTVDIWNRMFDDDIHLDSPAYGVIVSGIAAAAGGVWDTVADAFGLESRYVELVLAEWYEADGDDGIPPPITWDEFLRRYEKEKAEWEVEVTP